MSHEQIRTSSHRRKIIAYELLIGHRMCRRVSFFPSASALPPGSWRAVGRELDEREAGRGLPECPCGCNLPWWRRWMGR